MNEFFPSSDLNNLSFYLYCPSLKSTEKEEICSMIQKNNGVSIHIIIYIYIF